MASTVTLDILINPRDMAKAVKALNQFKGLPLKQLMLRVEKAAIGLYVNPLKRRAAVHNLTGRTQKSIRVGILRTTHKEIAAYKVGPTTWYGHFAIVGTRTGVRADPYVDEIRDSLAPKIFGFIDEQVGRLT